MSRIGDYVIELQERDVELHNKSKCRKGCFVCESYEPRCEYIEDDEPCLIMENHQNDIPNDSIPF